MPTIYLSPSTQEYNPYAGGGNEEYYMNLVTDEMIPYLRSTGIRYVRNDPDQRVSAAIAQSNAGNYDLHLAIHSNAGPESMSGQLKGTDVYYFAGSPKGQRAADIIAQNFKEIYPDPEDVKPVSTTSLAELRQTRAPSVLIEVAYHDNPEDAKWIRENTEQIAKNLSMSLAEYFGIPFVEPMTPRAVQVPGNLEIKVRPSPSAAVQTVVPQGSQVELVGEWENWYVVDYYDGIGYIEKSALLV